MPKLCAFLFSMLVTAFVSLFWVSVFGGLQINGSQIGGSRAMQDKLYFKH